MAFSIYISWNFNLTFPVVFYQTFLIAHTLSSCQTKNKKHQQTNKQETRIARDLRTKTVAETFAAKHETKQTTTRTTTEHKKDDDDDGTIIDLLRQMSLAKRNSRNELALLLELI